MASAARILTSGSGSFSNSIIATNEENEQQAQRTFQLLFKNLTMHKKPQLIDCVGFNVLPNTL